MRESRSGSSLRDLGEYRLKDFEAPIRLHQLVSAGLIDDFPAVRALGADRTNLPVQVTSFVGRERELGEVIALTGSHRLVTLVGIGGTGKTRLMIEAGRMIDRPVDGAWLVELASLTNGDLVPAEIARALGLQPESNRPIDDALVDFLRSKNVLLLLDNCEQVVDAVARTVKRLLAECPNLSVITTSLEPLAIDGETVFGVPTLSLPPHPDPLHQRVGDEPWLDRVRASDAVELFVERAQAALPSFELDSDNATAVAEICQRLDGIPLALELAAARVALLSVEEIKRRLDDRFRLLSGGQRTAVARQQTLRALVDWSWELLEDGDQQLLRRLSVFAGGWTLDAASSVAPWAGPANDRDISAEHSPLDTLDGLSRLVKRSLVWSSTVTRRATASSRPFGSTPVSGSRRPAKRTSCGTAISTTFAATRSRAPTALRVRTTCIGRTLSSERPTTCGPRWTGRSRRIQRRRCVCLPQ